MEVYENLLQGSEEWEQVRKGRATASEFSEFLTSKGAFSKSKKTTAYMHKLIAECVQRVDPNAFTGNKHTEWGQMYEFTARIEAQNIIGKEIHEVGFAVRDDKIIGCSPDGLIKDPKTGEWVEGVELKCPSVLKNHIGYLMAGVLPACYALQVHGSMAVTGLNVWHFLSYHPQTLPFYLRVERNELTEAIGESLDEFLIEFAEVKKDVLEKILPSEGEAA